MKKVLVPLAQGFEEIEAITIIDILRRAEINVTVATVDDQKVIGAHGINVIADKTINEVKDQEFDSIVLPGGMPGTKNLLNSTVLKEIIKNHYDENKTIGAICAAPMILNELGILDGKSATIYPGMEQFINRASASTKGVVVDGNIVTARGPGMAGEFALTLVSVLIDKAIAKDLSQKLLINMD